MFQSESQARLAAVQYAHTVFPAHHIPSRYVLLLACGDRLDYNIIRLSS